MDTRNQSICLWSGYSFLFIYMLGFVIVAGFIPPLSPSLAGQDVSVFFQENSLRILAGMSICVVASGLFIPWSVAITGQMLRVENCRFPAFSYMQLAAGILGAAFFMISPFFWIVMAYRADHLSDSMLLFNDYAWLSWLISWPFFFVQNFSFGLCGLLYKNSIIPRWVAYLSIFSAIGMLPMSLMVFVKSGPFAWNGLFGLYLPVGLYAVWYNVVFVVLKRAIKDEALGSA